MLRGHSAAWMEGDPLGRLGDGPKVHVAGDGSGAGAGGPASPFQVGQLGPSLAAPEAGATDPSPSPGKGETGRLLLQSPSICILSFCML